MNQKKSYHKKWIVLEKIKSGGQATVLKVRNSEDDQIYALKRFSLKKFQKKKLKRIQTEISIIKKLNGNRNVVRIYDDNLQEVLDNKDTSVFYVMDYSPHGSLRDNDFYFNDVEAALRLFKEILIGVNSAHKAGVIHRDLKPDNILLYPTQKSILITDFGIGLLKEQAGDGEITEEDEIVGPLHFIAPEQYKNPSQANEKSDIYSLGKVLLFILTGKVKIFREEIGDLASLYEGSNPYLPLIQESLLSKMIVDDAKLRFSNVDDIIEETNLILDKISDNSKRYLTKRSPGPRIYNLLIGEDKANFINRFKEDLMVSLKILEWGLIDLNREKKEKAGRTIIEEIKAKYTEEKVQNSVDCVDKYVNDPKDLKSIETKNTKYSFAAYYLSKYFYNNKSHRISHEYIEKALSLEDDPEIILSYLLHFSDVCAHCKCNLKHDFDERIKALIRITTDIEKKTNLFRILGNHYLETGSKNKGLLFLEAYLNINPFDSDVRFTCAYEYSEINDRPSSLYHYLIALENSKDISNITNNLGVLYERENMPIKCMEMYKKSFSLGNTLAGSNIASQYLQIGLKDKALDMLRNIIRDNKSGYDTRVDKTLGSVQTSVDDEEKSEKQLSSQGSLLSQYKIGYVEQLSTGHIFDWSGYWELMIGGRYVIQIIKENDILNIKQGGDSKIKINGIFDGNCLEIQSLVLDESDYSSGNKYDSGYLYITDDNNLTGYIRNELEKPKEVKGSKIGDIDKYRDEHKIIFDSLAKALMVQ